MSEKENKEMSSKYSTENIFFFSAFENEIRFENENSRQSVEVKETPFNERLVEFSGLFEPIPLIDAIVITIIIIVLTIFFNTLIAIYYRKAKTSNRPYVLALVVLDFICILFVLPLICLQNVDQRNLFTVALEQVRNVAGIWIFLLNLIPSFFLAVDRFMAVFFSHKFKLWLKKIRNFKIVVFVIDCVTIFLYQFTYLINSDLKFWARLITAFSLLTVVLSSFAMYIGIYVNLVKAEKNMVDFT